MFLLISSPYREESGTPERNQKSKSLRKCVKELCLNGDEGFYLKILKAVTVHGCMEENVVNSTCGGTGLKFNVRKDPCMEVPSDNDQKRTVQKQHFPTRKSFFNFHCQKMFTFFSYRCAIFFNHGLQHYCFLGLFNLNRLCGLRKMSRQIWTIFLVQK